MRFVACDDEFLALSVLKNSIMEARPDAELTAFSDPEELLDFSKDNPTDVAFLDIEMGGMTGLEVAKALKEIYPEINIVFVTGYRQYMGEAWELMASGYVTKPVTAQKIEEQLGNLRYRIEDKEELKPVVLKCFGNFDFFVNGEAPHFSYEKSKEVIAYLTDRRGTRCTTQEICAVIWEDPANHGAYFQKIRKDIRETMEKAGQTDVICTGWGEMWLDTEKVSCDYYDYLEKKPGYENLYRGEYMQQYSWGEYVNARLQDEH